MKKVVTAGQMRALDRAAIEACGIPGIVLMENAGRGAADELERALPDLTDRRVAVLCGRGNNGGDGFVICRHLLNRGITTSCILLGRVADLSGEARANADILLRSGVPLVEATEADQLVTGLESADVIVDALLGTGLASSPRGLFAEAIELVNALPAFVLAVDVPSGVDADSGRAFEPAIRADLTVTMGLLKRGLLLHPGRALAGRTVVADIGVPESLLLAEFDTVEIEDEDIGEWLPARPPAGHKGTFGTALIVAGSRGYSGAACLAGMAAVRAGTGLVKLAFPAGIADIVESRLLEAVKFSLPETPEGTIAPSAVNQIIALSRDAACVAIGPGLGAGPASQELVRALLPRLNCPVVIDADAISCLADSCELLREMKNPVVLTPHPGEMSRLVGRPAAEVDRDRVEVARGFAADHQVIVVLKGAPTVIAAPGEPAFLNPTGGSGLATGGTGDVLTGLIAGLLAQGCRPLDAATAGVWLHGKAGDLGSEALTPYSLCAGDLLDYLPEAFAAALTPAGEA
jgi:NAD(P)H-hydrate epimerase